MPYANCEGYKDYLDKIYPEQKRRVYMIFRLGIYPTRAHLVRKKRTANVDKICPCSSTEEGNINHPLLRCSRYSDLQARWLQPLNELFGTPLDANAVAVYYRVDLDIMYQRVSSFLWGIWPQIKVDNKVLDALGTVPRR